jgi:hypothetical protein
MDVHRDFCQVAIADGGRACSAGRINTRPEQLELFGQSLAPTDRVVMEATGNALAIAKILEPYVAEVVLAHAKLVRAISHARIKADKIDARVLADLLAADLIPAVWIGDERVRMLRRLVSRRRGLVKRRTQVKNEISAVLHRNLKGRCPASDPFGIKGRAWIVEQQLPLDERLTVDAGNRHQPPGVLTCQRDAGELGIDQLQLLAVEVQLAQQRPDRAALVGRQVLLGQPRPALATEQVGGRAARHEVAMQNRLHAVLQPGALANDVRAAGDLATPGLGLGVGDPHPGQKAGGQQLRQDRRIDLVGLHARLGNRPGLLRIADDDPLDCSSLTIACVLPVASSATSSLGARLSANTRSASGVVSIQPAWRTSPSSQIATCANSRCTSSPIHLRAACVTALTSVSINWVKQSAGKTTPTDPRSKRIRASRRGGHLLTRPRGPLCNTGLPDRVCFRMPPSRTI